MIVLLVVWTDFYSSSAYRWLVWFSPCWWTVQNYKCRRDICDDICFLTSMIVFHVITSSSEFTMVYSADWNRRFDNRLSSLSPRTTKNLCDFQREVTNLWCTSWNLVVEMDSLEEQSTLLIKTKPFSTANTMWRLPWSRCCEANMTQSLCCDSRWHQCMLLQSTLHRRRISEPIRLSFASKLTTVKILMYTIVSLCIFWAKWW